MKLILETRDGTWVKVGGPDGLDDRLALAPEVLAAVRARGIRARYVDLRVPGDIVVLPVAPAALRGAPADASSAPRVAGEPSASLNSVEMAASRHPVTLGRRWV